MMPTAKPKDPNCTPMVAGSIEAPNTTDEPNASPTSDLAASSSSNALDCALRNMSSTRLNVEERRRSEAIVATQVAKKPLVVDRKGPKKVRMIAAITHHTVMNKV